MKAAAFETSANDNVFAYLRKNGNREVLVLLNLSEQALPNISVTDDRVEGRFQNVFSGDATEFKNRTSLVMQPWEYLVFEK